MDLPIANKLCFDLGNEIFGIVYYTKSGLYNILLNSNLPEEVQNRTYIKAYTEVLEKKPLESWFIKNLNDN